MAYLIRRRRLRSISRRHAGDELEGTSRVVAEEKCVCENLWKVDNF